MERLIIFPSKKDVYILSSISQNMTFNYFIYTINIRSRSGPLHLLYHFIYIMLGALSCQPWVETDKLSGPIEHFFLCYVYCAVRVYLLIHRVRDQEFILPSCASLVILFLLCWRLSGAIHESKRTYQSGPMAPCFYQFMSFMQQEFISGSIGQI